MSCNVLQCLAVRVVRVFRGHKKNSVSSKPNPLPSPKYTLLIFPNKNKASEETLIPGSFSPPPNQYPPRLGVETSEP